MSEDVVTRQPLTARATKQRSLEERIGSRFPRVADGIARVLTRLWGALPPRSRLRKALLRRYVPLGLAAGGRGDPGVGGVLYHPDVEMVVPRQLVGLGFDRLSRGREERIRFQETWAAEWGEFAFVPEEVIDLGDRLLVIGRVRGSGLASGAGFDEEWADVFELSAGRVIREQAFFSHTEGFEAAGLSE